MLSDIGGQQSRTGGLSVSLAGSDGRILGGCVAGVLTAASPVQVCLLILHPILENARVFCLSSPKWKIGISSIRLSWI